MRFALEHLCSYLTTASYFLYLYLVYLLRLHLLGGGDFVQMFGADGKLQYWKELDPQL